MLILAGDDRLEDDQHDRGIAEGITLRHILVDT